MDEFRELIEIVKVHSEKHGVNLSQDAFNAVAKGIANLMMDLLRVTKKMAAIESRSVLLPFDIDAAYSISLVNAPKIDNVESKSHLVKNYSSTTVAVGNIESLLDLVKPLPLILRMHWLAIDGIQTLVPENEMDQNALLSVQDDSEKKKSIKCVLSREQREFYNLIKRGIYSFKTKRRKACLKAIRHFKGIESLIPLFLRLIIRKISSHSDDFSSLDRSLDLVGSLIASSNVNLCLYIDKITHILFFCIFKPCLCKNHVRTYDFRVREKAAFIIAQLCRHGEEDLISKIEKFILSKIFEGSKEISTGSLYGALNVLIELETKIEGAAMTARFLELFLKIFRIPERNGEETIFKNYLIGAVIKLFKRIEMEFNNEKMMASIVTAKDFLGEKLMTETHEMIELFI